MNNLLIVIVSILFCIGCQNKSNHPSNLQNEPPIHKDIVCDKVFFNNFISQVVTASNNVLESFQDQLIQKVSQKNFMEAGILFTSHLTEFDSVLTDDLFQSKIYQAVIILMPEKVMNSNKYTSADFTSLSNKCSTKENSK